MYKYAYKMYFMHKIREKLARLPERIKLFLAHPNISNGVNSPNIGRIAAITI